MTLRWSLRELHLTAADWLKWSMVYPVLFQDSIFSRLSFFLALTFSLFGFILFFSLLSFVGHKLGAKKALVWNELLSHHMQGRALEHERERMSAWAWAHERDADEWVKCAGVKNSVHFLYLKMINWLGKSFQAFIAVFFLHWLTNRRTNCTFSLKLPRHHLF